MTVSGFRPVKVGEANVSNSVHNQFSGVTKSDSEMITIPERTTNIDFEHGGFQNVGTMPDMQNVYDENDPGRKYAVSLPVIYNDFAAKHLQEDNIHSSRLAWIKANESDFVRAIEQPEIVEKLLRARNDGYYSATHIVKVSAPTCSGDEYMVVAISLSKGETEKAFHQITTIHNKAYKDIFKKDGTLRDKYKKP